MNAVFTPAYFIAKFEAIPDELWWVGSYDGPGETHCAMGHCGAMETEEGRAFFRLLEHIEAGDLVSQSDGGSGPAIVNDCRSSLYQQTTPKARILAALRDVQGKEPSL